MTVNVTEGRSADGQRLAHASRLTIIGELTASIAHEISQPLAAIALTTSACQRWLAGDNPSVAEARECLKRISADADRLREVIGRVRALSRKTTSKFATLPINEVIEQALDLAGHELDAKETSVRLELSPALPPVLADRIQLQQVLLNLILNAVQAMLAVPPERRHLVIHSGLKGDKVFVEIHDSGPGLSAEARTRLFTPFFTTKADGLGLGLSITQSIIEAHGGTIGVVSRSGGATFRFELPSSAARAA